MSGGAKKHIFPSGIDLANSELLNARFQNQFSFPDEPEGGQVIYRSDIGVGAFYDGVNEKWRFFGIAPNKEPYDDEASLFLDQENQDSFFQYLVLGEDKIYIYLGTTVGDISDYLLIGGGGTTLDPDIVDALEAAAAPNAANPFATMDDIPAPGGGTDTNAVHYNAADGKTASEKYQARTNIGSLSGEPQIITDSGTITTIGTRTSNVLVFTGADVILNNLGSGGFEGEQIAIINLTNGKLQINANSGSPLDGRFLTSENVPRFFDPYEIVHAYFTFRWAISSFTGFPSGVKFRGSANSSSAGLVDIFNSNSGGIAFSVNNGSGTRYYKINGSGVVTALRGGTYTRDNTSSSSSGHLEAKARSGQSSAHLNFASRDASNVLAFGIYTNGNFYCARSAAANEGIRRDEQRLYYSVSITTAGAINDQSLTAGIFNYRFTAATSITGFGNGEIGMIIDFDNVTGSTLTLNHENAASIAANRIKLIGASDLVIPIDGKVTLKYCTGSRWELVSKNF